MAEQLNFLDGMERKTREAEHREKLQKMYQQWLGLPEKTLVREGTPERESLRSTLEAGYCRLYGSAHHECPGMPENEFIWMNYCEHEYWVLNKAGEVAGEHIEVCPYCGAELGKGKGDAYLYKADPRYWAIAEIERGT